MISANHEALHYAIFFQLPVTYLMLGPNIFLSATFVNILILCASLNVRQLFS